MKGRIGYIDLAKGICILLVVLDHISDFGYFAGGNYPMNDIFEQTRMPLYFILSGLFFKDYPGGIKEFLLRKFNRILVPYLFFMFLYLALNKAVFLLTGTGIGEVWSPLWFLLCLFWMNVIFAIAFYAVQRNFSSPVVKETVLGICLFGIGIVGYYAGYLPLRLGTAMTCMPFLWMGYVLNRRVHLFEQRISSGFALLAGIVLFVALHFLYMGDNQFYINTYSAPLPFVWLSGLMGTLAVLLLSRAIRWLPIVSYIGRYSIIVLCTHIAIVKAVIAALSLLPDCQDNALWQNTTIQSLVVLVLTLACSVFCCWFLHKYLPWFTAQKDLIPTNAS